MSNYYYMIRKNRVQNGFRYAYNVFKIENTTMEEFIDIMNASVGINEYKHIDRIFSKTSTMLSNVVEKIGSSKETNISIEPVYCYYLTESYDVFENKISNIEDISSELSYLIPKLTTEKIETIYYVDEYFSDVYVINTKDGYAIPLGFNLSVLEIQKSSWKTKFLSKFMKSERDKYILDFGKTTVKTDTDLLFLTIIDKNINTSNKFTKEVKIIGKINKNLLYLFKNSDFEKILIPNFDYLNKLILKECERYNNAKINIIVTKNNSLTSGLKTTKGSKELYFVTKKIWITI